MNNWNSFYAKSFFLSLFNWGSLSLFFCCLSVSAQSIEETDLAFSQLDLKQLSHSFKSSENANPDKALAGFYQSLNQPLFSDSRAKKTHSQRLGHEALTTYYYLSYLIAAEDSLFLDESLFRLKESRLELLGPFSSTRELVLKDAPPYNNSSITVKGLIYRPKSIADFGDAGACQINPFCLDSTNQNLRAMVHILWVNGNLAGFCSGSLVNNTALDFKPYILSAEHCALTPNLSSSSDFARWAFTFNYFSRSCKNPNSPQAINQDRLVGANLLARSDDNGGDYGSDLLLLELNQNIPSSFNAYYAGWNRWDRAAKSGLCYHFPAGDILKVSSYKKDAVSSSFTELSQNTHWKIEWSANSAGHGTTEAGSSGAPIFDQNGLVVGTLTGGGSACDNLEAPDYFGRFDYHWDSNGNNANRRLRDWLDPINSGTLALDGMEENEGLNPRVSPQWTIAPNPFTSTQSLSLIGLQNIQEPLKVRWTDLGGKIRIEEFHPPRLDGEIELNCPFQEAGIYLVEVIQGSSIKQFKIMKL